MKAPLYCLLTFCLALISLKSVAQEIREKLEQIAVIEQKIMMPMRDGVRLATDIYRPKTNDKVPVIFSRTPYNFNTWGDGKEVNRTYERAYEAVKHGYAYVVQNERGRFFSEGEWDILGTPLTDGYDAFTWMSEQPWSNGKIGTLGCSSTAEWQMAVAALDHPAHTAMVPQGFGAGVGRIDDFYEQGNWYRGGVEQMLFFSWLYSTQHDRVKPVLPEGVTQEDLQRIQRFYDMAPEYPEVDWSEGFKHLPLQDLIKHQNGPVGIYEKMIRRKPNDQAWFEGGLYHDDMGFGVPSYWFVSWYDVATSPNLALFNHIRNNIEDREVADNQYLVIAPTLHCRFTRATENTVVGERNMGDARLNYEHMVYSWFDYWLKGEQNGFPEETPRVQYFTMGSNQWQSSDSWPPPEVQMTTLFLGSDGEANSLFGDGTLSLQPPDQPIKDSFTYDPLNPVPSHGGGVCCMGNALEGGAFDQQQLETRNDILVYTTDPLQQGIEVTGFVEATIYISSDVKDTDFTIKLLDVYPDGRAFNLDETIQRVRYRDGYDQEVFMEEEQVYKLEFSKMSTSNYFKPGHRIRIEISSSNFPRFARNLNTGGNNYDEVNAVIANNDVHHGKDYPSQIKLPVIGSISIENR